MILNHMRGVIAELTSLMSQQQMQFEVQRQELMQLITTLYIINFMVIFMLICLVLGCVVLVYLVATSNRQFRYISDIPERSEKKLT